jgi:dihydrofolate reductase
MEPKRRIVAFDRVSADGYFAGSDGNLDWVVPEEELDKGAVANLSGADTILFGRRTYDLFEGFWPHALDDSATAADPHGPGRRSKEMRAMAVWINEATKVVFSRTRQDVTWKNSRLLHEFGSIVSQLTQHGLIDEYHFVVGPILLGSGRPLLSGVAKRSRLDLLEAKKHPSGNVTLRYACSS